MPHPADADYTAQHFPSEADLELMADSAVALANVLNARNVARRHRPDVLMTMAPSLFVTDCRTTPPRPGARYDRAVLDAALLATRQAPGRASAAESATIGTSLEVVREHLDRLRGLGIAADPIMAHALTSLDLGLIGLATVMGDADADGG